MVLVEKDKERTVNKSLQSGTVYWVTGLAGSGKTTFGKILHNQIKQKNEKIIFLDGDELRSGLCNDLGYSEEDRRICAYRYSKLCEMLAKQGFDIICCTISMFDEVRTRNRSMIPNYREIYMKVNSELLKERNQKKLYHNSNGTKANFVVGVDIDYEVPKNPDYVIETNTIEELYQYTDRIIKGL